MSAPRSFRVEFLAIIVMAIVGAEPLDARVNRLANERSRYLVEHGSNPVEWYPWGEAAFAKAKREAKPVFLSIGYASCHWCHVMERESFESKDIAAILNADFVPILVDREEHPDVDATYMSFVRAMTGSAGWPSNLVLTPELRPIVGATYLTREALTRLLSVIRSRWADDREALLSASEQLMAMTTSLASEPASHDETISPKLLQDAVAQIHASYDATHGGFGDSPRFSQPGTIDFLLRYARATGDAQAREMALHTLRQIADGGIHDQIGGGFHRYAVDPAWRMPHFEKLLYDQALLAVVFVEAWQMTAEARFATVARSTLDFALAELQQSNSAFDSGRDADTLDDNTGKMEDGAVYVWESSELFRLLGKESAEMVAFHYGVNPVGKQVLAVHKSIETTAKRFGVTAGKVEKILRAARQRMLRQRGRRPQPLRDDKVVSGWNGLMISALARAGAALDEPRYIAAAARTARFLRSSMYEPKSRKLMRRFRAGHAGIEALSEDYAYVIAGLLDLYESNFDLAWLDFAIALQQRHDELFWSATERRHRRGGTIPASLGAVVRESDMTMPSHNSVSAMNLLRLADLTDDAEWRARAAAVISSFAGRLQTSPAELPQLLAALLRQLATSKQIVIAGDPAAADTKALLRVVNERFLPNRTLIVLSSGEAQARLARRLPFLRQMAPISNRATAYICEHHVCKLPTSDPSKVAQILEER